MKRTLLLTTSLAVLGAGFATGAIAAVNELSDRVVADLQSQGYGYIEIEQSPAQLKVEAVRGNDTIEAIYDLASGQRVSEETQPAEAEDLAMSGVEIGAAHDGVGDGGEDGTNDDADGTDHDEDGDGADDDGTRDDRGGDEDGTSDDVDNEQGDEDGAGPEDDGTNNDTDYEDGDAGDDGGDDGDDD